MEQTYMAKALIDVDVNSQKYQDFINTVEKKGATIKVNPDIDASKFLSKFEGLLRKHPEKLVIEADTSKINKSLSMVRGFVGKSGAEIGKSFSDSMKNGFDNVSFDKMVRESLKSGERISQKARASYIEDLNKTVSKGFNAKNGDFQINSKNYLEIEKIIDAYERLAVAKRELGTSTNKDIISALDNSSKYLKANPYKNIGNNIAENINDMVASVEKAQRSAVSKLENFQTEIANILSGKGISSTTPTGNSQLSDSLAKENEALKSQIAILEKNSTKLQDVQKRLEAASLKLSRSGHLKGRSKGLVNEEFSSALSSYISQGGTLNKDIVQQNESLRGTKYYTEIEKELLTAFNLVTKSDVKSPKDTTNNDVKQKLLDSIKQAGKNLVSLYHRSLEDDNFNDHKLADAYENFQKIGGSKKDLINAFKSKYGKTRFKDEILDFSASMQQDFGFPGMTKFLAGSDKIQQEYLETAQAAQTAQKAIEESNKSLNKQKTLSQKSYTVSFYGNKKDAEAGLDSSLKLLPKAQSFISKKPKIDNITTPESIPTDSSQNVQKELSDITTLKNAVKNVTQAVNEKTAAFKNEQQVVSSVAINEKNSLGMVDSAVKNIANDIPSISSAFKTQREEILAIINSIKNDITGLFGNIETTSKRIDSLKTSLNTVITSPSSAKTSKSLADTGFLTLVSELNSLDINDSILLKIEKLKSITRSLNELNNTKTLKLDVSGLTLDTKNVTQITDLAVAIEMLCSQLKNLKSNNISKGLLDGLKVSSANVKNLNSMADALDKINASLKNFSTDSITVLNSISGITKQLEGLKNLNSILKSGKKISTAVKEAENAKTKSADTKDETKNVKKDLSGTLQKLKGKAKDLQFKIDKGEVANLDLYKQKLTELNSIISNIEAKTSNGIFEGTQEDLNILRNLEAQANQIHKSLNSDSRFKPVNETSRQKAISKANDRIEKNTGASEDTKQKMRSIRSEMYTTNAKADMSRLVGELNRVENEAVAAGKAGVSFGSIWKKRMQSLWAYFGSYRLVYSGIAAIKRGIQTIKEYDSALTEMRKVSNETLSSLKQYQVETFDVGNTIGTSAKTIQNTTADWLRLGEAMDEARESAKATSILYNVSEFKNINEASDGLVAISQAYKDIEKMEIVDKINYIGNNYAIATDELTAAMQRSSAALLTQGNNIDEAIALTTAGNTVIQDAEKVGTAMTTISLRIAGTEVAKKELENLGEDIEDYVIRTTSKTDDIIKKYTTVASNDFKGVSVLDENGNLKNTYEILLAISKIYKEIQEEDKKQGTNRANALIEELGGKRQANIVASILSNPDILESVYEDSKENSTGSALKENEKELESIEAQFTRLKNSADEFWQKFIGSDVVKGVTKLLNLLVSGENSVLNITGAIPQILGLIAGYKAFTGKGYFIIHSTNGKKALENLYCIS